MTMQQKVEAKKRLIELRAIRRSGAVNPAVVDFVDMLIAETERVLGKGGRHDQV